MFRSLINELCKWVGVEEFKENNWVELTTQIFSLKKQGEVTSTKCKKRKIDSGKSLQVETDSYRPSSARPFEVLTIELRIV